MAGSGRKNADDLLALAMASGRTVEDAAKSSGVSERTVYRRLGDPVFRKRIQEIRADMLSQATGRIADGMNDAVEVLRTLLNARSETVALGACRTILEVGVRLRDSVELNERLDALEAREGREASTLPRNKR